MYTVCHTEASPAAVGVPLIKGRGNGTAGCPVIDIGPWASLTGTITAYHGDERIFFLCSHPEDRSDLLHHR
jgi:hypothetical protein